MTVQSSNHTIKNGALGEHLTRRFTNPGPDDWEIWRPSLTSNDARDSGSVGQLDG